VHVVNRAVRNADISGAVPFKGTERTSVVGWVVIVDNDVNTARVLVGRNVFNLAGIEVQPFGELLNDLCIGFAPLVKPRSSTPDQVPQRPRWWPKRRGVWFGEFVGIHGG
jgi:hypothetical protein